MKVAILAGGLGSRLSEETVTKPKPMVEIGGMPILWHIMMNYAYYGHNHFYIALGYKGEYIKKYMVDYANLASDLKVNLQSGQINKQGGQKPDWDVHLIDTGMPTQTGGRVKRLADHLNGETFFLTYGDGVSNINIKELLAFHKSHGKLATLTAVHPPARFGYLEFDDNSVTEVAAKPQIANGWINGGFFVMEPGIFDYIEDDLTPLEQAPLRNLASDGQLMAYKHEYFWQCMDTLRDKVRLEKLWLDNEAPWKIWE